MKIKRLVIAASFLLYFCHTTTASAQYLYQFVFTGTSSTTDANGRIVTRPIDNRALINDYALSQGVTNTSYIGLAYHIGGNALGDTIDLINKTNGTFLHTLFGLYFGESFGRMALLSASHRQQQRIEYIYTDQNSHSLGSALLTDYYWFDANGNTNKTAVLGQMQWLVTPDGVHTNVQVYSGSLATVRPWQFR